MIIGVICAEVSHLQNNTPAITTSSPTTKKKGAAHIFMNNVMFGPLFTLVGASIMSFSNVYCESLYKGLINEFFLILRWINEYFDNKINIYFSKSNNIHHYDNRIFLTHLNVKSANPKYSLDNNNFLIEGFSWHSKCIFENYFEKDQNYKTLFLDIKLEKEIARRMNFIKNLSNFNFNNFNNAVGRTALHPMVRNYRYNQVARDL